MVNLVVNLVRGKMRISPQKWGKIRGKRFGKGCGKTFPNLW